MSKSAASSGGAGDIVYSIPVLRRLGVKKLYVKETLFTGDVTLFSTVAPLMRSQGIECIPTNPNFRLGKFDPAIRIDYNLDTFRHQPLRGKNHVIKSYCQQFGLSTEGWNEPFLNSKPKDLGYSLIHLTERWRETRRINWKWILKNIEGPVFFIGFRDEWKSFLVNYADIPFQPTANLLDMAQWIKCCSALYCNQSVALTIAQGLGKKYFLERKPGKTNTLFYTQNETIL